MKSDKVNACVDCTYCAWRWRNYVCNYTPILLVSRVTGEFTPLLCADVRQDGGLCGEQGQHFVPIPKKESWFSRLFRR